METWPLHLCLMHSLLSERQRRLWENFIRVIAAVHRGSLPEENAVHRVHLERTYLLKSVL